MARNISTQLHMRKQPLFQKQTKQKKKNKKAQFFLKSITFINSTTRNICTNLLTFYVILLTSVVICKQRLLHGKEIVEFFPSYQYYNIDREYFRKNL